MNPFTPSKSQTQFFNPQPGYAESGWKYLGCANETDNGRALNGAAFTNATSMTNQVCAAYCASKNFPYAGTEYGQE